MNKTILSVVLALIALFAVACEPTNDTAQDAESAQSLMPSIAGYTSQSADNVQEAIATALGAGSVASGNLPAAALIERVDSMIDCYQNVGAVDARIFFQQEGSLIPHVGAVAVVNETRLIDNFLNCMTSTRGLSAQTADAFEVCNGSGRITVAGDSIAYLYVATSPNFCSTVQNYFNGLNESTR